jgi:threonine dehydrogenase-like Zn-dependent dehydrogenase
MRATVMYEAGDVRVENVPDAGVIEPTDALVRVTGAAICGSDLWPYKTLEHTDSGRRMGHEAIGVVDAVGADVATVKPGDLVIMPFAYSDGTCEFCHDAFRPRASTAGSSGAAGTSTAPRPKRSACPRPTVRSRSCRAGPMTR